MRWWASAKWQMSAEFALCHLSSGLTTIWERLSGLHAGVVSKGDQCNMTTHNLQMQRTERLGWGACLLQVTALKQSEERSKVLALAQSGETWFWDSGAAGTGGQVHAPRGRQGVPPRVIGGGVSVWLSASWLGFHDGAERTMARPCSPAHVPLLALHGNSPTPGRLGWSCAVLLGLGLRLVHEHPMPRMGRRTHVPGGEDTQITLEQRWAHAALVQTRRRSPGGTHAGSSSGSVHHDRVNRGVPAGGMPQFRIGPHAWRNACAEDHRFRRRLTTYAVSHSLCSARMQPHAYMYTVYGAP